MTDYPDFSPNNYQIISELGRNNKGGRITYLAQQTTTKQQVVIKQFQFAKMGATWAEYDAYEQEIAMLRHLDHPGIPKYLDSFQTGTGFCMVQEYINAQSLAVSRSWSPLEIQYVAIATLEILAYLQSLNPSVIHRDLKPENILADENLNIYLVDFGFARLGGGEIAASSVVKGTMGFMPPEQLFNRQLTTSSDLYGLGATLICLLTGIKSANIGSLIDENYRIQFQHLVPPLKRGLISWLEKISGPNLKQRYANAAAALAVLKSLEVDRLPKVRVNRTNLEFVAEEFREKVTETITITNPIPETVLTGRWEVASHKSDPPHTPYDHAWIEFDSYQFEGNEVQCKITVDTSKLLAEKSYQRELWLHSNSGEESWVIPVEVKTALVKKTLFFNYLATLGATALFTVGLFGLIDLNLSLLFSHKLSIFSNNQRGLFPLFLLISSRILCDYAAKKRDNLFGSVLFIFAFFLFAGLLPLNYDISSFDLFQLFTFFVGCFVLTMFCDFAIFIALNCFPNENYEASYLDYFAFIILMIMAGMLILTFAVLFPNPDLYSIRFGTFALKLLLEILFISAIIRSRKAIGFYANKNFLTRKDVDNNLILLGFTMSCCIAYILEEKLFFKLAQNFDNFLDIFGLAIIILLPILFFGFLLVKQIQAMVKRWRAIARYNREKPNLIKP